MPRRPSTDASKKPPPPRSRAIAALIVMGVLATVALVWFEALSSAERSEITYSAFYELLHKGQVSSVILDGERVLGELKSKQVVAGQERLRFRTVSPPEDDSLLPLLRTQGVSITAVRSRPTWSVGLLVSLLPWLMIFGVMFLLRQPSALIGPGRHAESFVRNRSHRYEKEAGITFDDVAGLASAKRDLREIVGFLRDPAGFRRLGARVPRGVLLVGPPGTGKTLLARAVAGESGVPFFSIAASEFVEMFVGVGAARVRDLFAEARKESPAILFIDEIDAVGRARGAGFGGGHDEREQTLNQLLSEMDGFSQDSATIVLAATNRPDVLDPALLRPGRFDRRVVLDRPELEARRSILSVHVRQKPLATDVNLDSLARATVGFTGADLGNLVNEAALFATHRGADRIAERDFAAALDKITLGDPREAKLDAAEKHRVAVHEAGHAVVARFLQHSEPLHRVSIIPRGMALGATQQLPVSDRHLLTRGELQARLAVLMGGSAAEKLLLSESSTGAENDLRAATKLATDMVAHYGMNERLGPVYLEHQTEHPFLGQRLATDGSASDRTIALVEAEARALLGRAHETAMETLSAHARELALLIQALLDRETVEQSELDELFRVSSGMPVVPETDRESPAFA